MTFFFERAGEGTAAGFSIFFISQKNFWESGNFANGNAPPVIKLYLIGYRVVSDRIHLLAYRRAVMIQTEMIALPFFEFISFFWPLPEGTNLAVLTQECRLQHVPMNPKNLVYFLTWFLLPVAFSACARFTSVVMPKTGTFMGSTGEGTVGKAVWTGHKCQAILDWIEPFKQEFPQTDLTVSPTGRAKIAQTASLFRDSVFVPVFGFEYNSYNAGKLYKINQKIIHACMGWGKHRNFYYKELFAPLKTFFDNTFGRSNPALVRYAQDYSRREAWMKKALEDLASVPATPEGFSDLEKNFSRPAEKELEGLSPQEQETFRNALEARRLEIARQVLKDKFPDLSEMNASLETAREIEKAYPYLKVLADANDEESRRTLDKLEKILSVLVNYRMADLQSIPLNEDGKELTRLWLIGFERDFSPFGKQFPQLYDRQLYMGVERREAVYRETKPSFIAKLEALDTGPDAVEAHQKLLDETFPYYWDKNMTVYRDYEAETRERQKTALKRMFEKAKIPLKEYLKALADLARESMD